METKINILRWLIAVVPAAILSIGGCKLSDEQATSFLPSDRFLESVTLEHDAINLSTIPPFDTVTIKVAALMADGSTSNEEPTYTVNSSAISISNGVLKAHSAVSGAMLIVKVVDGLVTRRDTVFVSVITTTPPDFDQFKFVVNESDSAKVAVGGSKIFEFRAGDETANRLNSLLVKFRSSDTTVAKIAQSGYEISIATTRPGRVALVASSFAYGKPLLDSLQFIVGWPLLFHLPAVERNKTGSFEKMIDFFYRDITIGTGGCVIWANRSQTMDLDIQFDQQENVVGAMRCGMLAAPFFFLIKDRVTGGNIDAYRTTQLDGTEEGEIEFFFSPYRARTFSAGGIYHYRSSIHGTEGVVRVCNENTDSVCAPKKLGAW